MSRPILEPAVPDSIADVAAHLAAWATRAPSGLASVAYDSEHSCRAVEAFLERALEEAGVAFSRIELPLRRPASEVVDAILERLGELSSGVASLRGFGTAFPDKDPLPDSLYAINLNRERLAGFPVRQIWWMPRPFADAFARVAPCDYLGWSDDFRYEPIDGVAYLMAPAPTMSHQEIAGKIYSKLGAY